MRYRPEQKAETRAKILAAAARMFRADGYAASGVKKVMAKADLTVGGFYAHFGSKERLLSEVLSESLSTTRNVLLAGLEEADGEVVVKEVARRYLSRLHRDMPADGCSLPSLTAEVSRQSDETKATFEAYLEELYGAFAGKVSRERMMALCALMVGGLMFARAVESKETSDQILMACKKFAAGELK